MKTTRLAFIFSGAVSGRKKRGADRTLRQKGGENEANGFEKGAGGVL